MPTRIDRRTYKFRLVQGYTTNSEEYEPGASSKKSNVWHLTRGQDFLLDSSLGSEKKHNPIAIKTKLISENNGKKLNKSLT